jgi:HK97 family phage portal protein
MEDEQKGFWRKVGDWFLVDPSALEIREGSVGSAGGDSPLPGVLPPSLRNDTKVTAEQALGVSAVYRAVSLIANGVSQLGLGVWRAGEEIEIVSANSNSLINKPSIDLSRSAFLEETAVSLATSGNAYWRLYGVGSPSEVSRTTAVEVLNPHAMSVDYDKGKKVYRYNGYRSGSKTFAEHEVKHLSLLRVPGSEYVLGPIQAAQAELRGALEMRDYSSTIFSDTVTPSGVLKSDQMLPPGKADEIKARYYAQMGGKKGVLVLDNNFTYTPVYLNPADAQFLENQQFSITQVARMFGIPASKLLAEVNGNSMTYTNMESANTDYVRDTLMGYLREIEEALSDLIPRGQSVKFKVEELLRADRKTRYDGHSIALAGQPFRTVNEIRAEEGLPPIPGGDVLPKKKDGDNGSGTPVTA